MKRTVHCLQGIFRTVAFTMRWSTKSVQVPFFKFSRPAKDTPHLALMAGAWKRTLRSCSRKHRLDHVWLRRSFHHSQSSEHHQTLEKLQVDAAVATRLLRCSRLLAIGAVAEKGPKNGECERMGSKPFRSRGNAEVTMTKVEFLT